jgi:hypothetical protein
MQQINADFEKLPKTPVGNDLDQVGRKIKEQFYE